MNLVIVESPNKVKKIQNYLGKEYEVIASVGHIKELENSGFNNSGVNDDGTLSKKISADKAKVVSNIKNKIKNTNFEKIYIATDLDREGEGIASDIYSILDAQSKKKAIRIGFRAITKDDITKAIKNPIGQIDQNLVAAQNARQGIDKIAGFTLSKFTKKQNAGISAGRCQSVALKIVIEREKEILEYQPTWKYRLNSTTIDDKGQSVKLTHIDENGKTLSFDQPEQIVYPTNPIVNIENVESDQKSTHPPKPYNTGDLLTSLNSKFSMSAKQSQNVLQRLFEAGLITYPRSTSNAVSSSFLTQLKQFVNEKYGSDKARSNFDHLEIMYDDDSIKPKKSSKNEETDPHECIRVTHLEMEPSASNSEFVNLSPQEQKTYKLIYERTLVQGFKDALYRQVVHRFESLNNQLFQASSKKYDSLGFKEIFNDDATDLDVIYYFSQNKEYKLQSEKEKFDSTSKPKPFTEGSLIAKLQKEEIGRPSTFSSYPTTILDRQYVSLEGTGKAKILQSTALGRSNLEALSQIDLIKSFIDLHYTKNLEEDLDKIAKGQLNGQTLLKNFLDKFKNLQSQLDSIVPTYPQSDVLCASCGVYRNIKTIANGSQMLICDNFSYNPKTKTQSGCKAEFLNPPKQSNTPKFKKFNKPTTKSFKYKK